MNKKSSLLFAICALLLTLSACAKRQIHGQLLPDDLVQKVKASSHTQEELLAMLGTPAIIPDYTKNVWYYVEQTTESKAFFKPKTIKQRVMRVEFNSNNITSRIDVIDNKHIDFRRFDSECTEARGTKSSYMQRFFKNAGRFRKIKQKKRDQDE
ncbi:Outer membrane protein assembly factor BamE [Rickettsiales endosymbiont of Paramecium tredecaurelia]|uniref:outer membrane protein assembly factor BamE n=1 Tax=Candidatus Sarmatiella mevalonica TaxID=2770581 RepID=UPI0019231B50|nr:outer membrane protein assembly factor BamE [Candidatus Sarmatiella mevalonica]MBL3284890.1 Outer membrane protein assembly factor BamE [Candidatus Sarmatiella mevalonica]